ncbi:PREDICTED: mucin-12-like [Papilio polytes]|uniref:mucin-12-like n=1 Tax=Papilio polytes TaxID=76194 RepID=UPI0006766335|nr:PREDICTED: mucin-12-like [Papilio polytes]
MKLSCALVLTLTNLVIATPFSFSVKGSGASAKAEAATSPFGQFGVVQPVASKTSGFSGTFSKASSSSYASSSASSSSSAFNYNAGQIGTASLGYGSQGLLVPNKNVGPQVVTVPQATAFATAGSNSQTGASVNAQATGSYSSEKGSVFPGNANIPANVQYQSEVPESKPNAYVGLSSEVPSHWHEQSKPNSFNTDVPEHSEKAKETFGVQSFSGSVQNSPAFVSTPAAPTQGSLENAPSYSGGFGGPPGILNPEISSVGSTPSYHGFVTYPSGQQLNVPNNQQTFINAPVSTVNPTYAQQDYPAGNVNPTIQSIKNEYVSHTENSEPSYKPDIKPSYLEQNKPSASSSYNAGSSEWQQNNGHGTVQAHAEISHTHKELEQTPHSVDHFSHTDKPFVNNQDSKPIKNVQIFVQAVPSKGPHSSPSSVQFTNTQIGSENKKEVKPTNQLAYTGGFGAPAGILKPSGQYVSSGQTFSSSPVKIEQYDSSPVALTTTGVKETSYNTGFGGLLNEVKETAQPSLQSSSDYSFESGSTSGTYVTPKPSSSSLFASSPSEQVSNDYISTEQKGTEQFSDKPSESSFQNPTVSSWTQNPTVNTLPIRPEFEIQKKPTGQNFFNTPSPSSHSPEQGIGGVSVSVDKTKPTTVSESFGQVSEKVNPTVLSTITNNGFAYSNSPYKPVVIPTAPQFQVTKQKESAVSFTVTQPTPVSFWQQSTTYKPSFEGSTPGYLYSSETSPTKFPSVTGDYTVSKQTEQYPSKVDSNPVDFQVTSTLNQQSSYGSTASSFVTQEPAAQVDIANPTLTSFSQESSYKPSIENSLPSNSASQFSESPKTSSTQDPSTGTFTVSKEVYKVPTQIVSNNVYPPSTVASGFHLGSNSQTSQSQSTSYQHQQSTNFGSTSFVTQKPTTVNFVSQTPDATSGLTSTGITQQFHKPTVATSLTTSSVSGSYVSSNVSPTQIPVYTESFNVPKETKVIPSDTSSNVDSTVGTAPAFSTNAFSGKPQTQLGVSQQSVEYKPASPLVTKEPTISSDIASQTVGSTSAVSQANKPTVQNSEGNSPGSGLLEIPKTTPSKNTPYQYPTKPTVVTGPQKQPGYLNVFGTGVAKPSRYSSSGSTGYPWSSSNTWSGPSYLTGAYDKPKQTIYFNQNKPVSSVPEKKETIIPNNQPYFTGNTNLASNTPTTPKPSVQVASLNVQQQSSSSFANQKEKESIATATSGPSTTYSKPTPQPILSNSGSYTPFASPKPTKPTNQPLTVNSAFPTFGSSFSQVKPQYQFSTVQPATQKKQWYTSNYGTFGAVKPNTYTYPGFTSSFTTFGQGSVGGLYDKTKQTTQYTSTGQYKPTSTGQYNPSLTGQYKPITTGQYKPTYNWGIASQSQFQKPSNQPTQTGGSYVSTYTQTTSKPFVTLSSFDKQKPTVGASVVNQKESSIPSSFSSTSGVVKPTNQLSTSYGALKPTASGTSFESGTGSPSLTNVSDKGKVTSSIVSTTSNYELQKPVNPTVQTVSNTYTTSFISAKPTAGFQTTGTPLLENKPTNSYNVQQQVFPSVQTITPTKDVINSELGQSIKPTWSSSTTTGVATSNLYPNTPSVEGQISPVKPTSTVHSVGETTSSVSTVGQKENTLDQFNGQIVSTNQASVPVGQKFPQQQSSEPFLTSVQANTEFHTHSQTQSAPTKPEYLNTFGGSWVQSSPPKQISGSLESVQKESVQHVQNEHVHSKPTNTAFLSTSQPQTVVGVSSANTQLPKTSNITTTYLNFKPDKVQYTTQTFYKPTAVVGSVSSYANQQTAKPTIIPTSQQTYSNIAVAGPTNPPGQYWVQSSPPKQISGSLESAQKESVQHVQNVHVHSKPTNTAFLSTSHPQTVVSVSSANTQFPKPSNITTLYFDSKPDKVQYTTQTFYKPTSVVGSLPSYANQQNAKPTIIPTSQEAHSNIAAGQTNPPGQYWALNTQSAAQQTAFQATKPNIKITVVGKPSSTIVSPPYSGGFGGPSGILKPNEFGISPNQENVQSQFQANLGAYNGAKVETNSNTASYFGGFGGPSGILKPDEKYTINHAGHDKPSSNGVHAGTSQVGAQANYNVVPAFPTPAAQGYVKEQVSYGSQVSSEVQGSSVANVAPNAGINFETSAGTNAAANASGFANSNAYASNAGVDKTGTSFGGQIGAINGFSSNSKGSATASATSSSFGGSFSTFEPARRLVGSPGEIARLLGRR